MAPVEVTDDYYAILEVHQAASEIEIKKSYRRLAIQRHPDKNRNTPEATASFQLLSTAYETLQNPTSRRIYDIKWPSITKTYRMAQEKLKRDECATKVEREKSAKENAAREAEEQMSRFTIDNLKRKKQKFESEIFEVKRSIARLRNDLKNIQAVEEKALAEQNARDSWWAKLWGAVPESDDEKQGRELQRLQRHASKTIKENELSRGEGKLKEWTDLLSGVEKAIDIEVAKVEERERIAEQKRQEVREQEKARTRQKVYEEYVATLRKKAQEEAERESVRRAEAVARAEKERAARLAAEERRRKEVESKRREAAEEAEKQRRRFEEASRQWREKEKQREREEKEAEEARKKEQRRKETKARAELDEIDPETLFYMYANLGRSPPSQNKARSPTASGSGSPHLSQCSHKGWWNKVESGSLVCTSCKVKRWKYVLECPTCQMRACAECRPVLQGRPPLHPR